MQVTFEHENHLDKDKNPAGGFVKGIGIDIFWQNGPMVLDGNRIEPNGAFVETVIAGVIQRIEHYQQTKFNCRENALALTKLQEALHWLNHRTVLRQTLGIEGTHKTGKEENAGV